MTDEHAQHYNAIKDVVLTDFLDKDPETTFKASDIWKDQPAIVVGNFFFFADIHMATTSISCGMPYNLYPIQPFPPSNEQTTKGRPFSQKYQFVLFCYLSKTNNSYPSSWLSILS
jgi:hypothetical protein